MIGFLFGYDMGVISVRTSVILTHADLISASGMSDHARLHTPIWPRRSGWPILPVKFETIDHCLSAVGWVRLRYLIVLFADIHTHHKHILVRKLCLIIFLNDLTNHKVGLLLKHSLLIAWDVVDPFCSGPLSLH